MKGRNKIFILLLSFFFVFSCQKEIEKKEGYRKGELKMTLDPSMESLGKALGDVFQETYPEVNMKYEVKVEDLAIADLVNGKVTMVITSRDLTNVEKEVLDSRNQNYSAAQIGYDAAVFIAAKNSALDKVNIEYLKENLLNPDNKFVFDNGNSSNFNTIMNKLELGGKKRHIKAVSSPEKVVEFIKDNPNHIGIISLGVLNNENKLEYLEKVKIIPVETEEIIFPDLSNLRNYKYPFLRKVSILNIESGFYTGSTFIKFAGSQRGQLIILKEGIQPYYVYPRRVQLLN